jgi:hypothetical protein
VLPVDSFTALWNLVTPPARNCNRGVSWNDTNGTATSVDLRKDGEFLKANLWLSEALGMVNRNPERAAQLARAALSVSAGRNRQRPLVGFAVEYARRYATSDPRSSPPGAEILWGSPYLDLSAFVKVLVQLRVVSPDLSDGLYQLAMNAVMASNPPLPTEIGQLAAYLFPTGTSVQLYDSLLATFSERGLRLVAELPAMPNFMAAELKGDSEQATEFLASAVRLLQNSTSTYEDPAGAYALAWQMLPKAREVGGENAGALEGALSFLEPQAGADAAKIRATLGTAPPPRKVEPWSPENDADTLGQACSDFRAANYEAARARLSGVADASARAEVLDLVQFAETSLSLPAKNAEQILDREIYPVNGAKRSLLYAAIAPAASNGTGALKAVTLGLKDAEPLPAAQRVCILPALASAALPAEPDQALAILRQLVAADNNAAASSGSGSSATTPDIRCRLTGPVEFVSTHERKLAFPLRAPGVEVFTIDALMERARAIELSKLESAVLELRDEAHQVNALLALAKLRLSAPSH